MKKNPKSKNKAGAAPKVDPYFEGVVAKLIDRLVSLEKKMDIIVAQTAGKVSGDGGSSGPMVPKLAPRRDRQLYEAICADCHKICEVPFKPSEDRPVYCKTCFAKRKSGGASNGMPILTPVALAPKPVSKLGAAASVIPPKHETSKKVKKSSSAKKSKKKK